MAITNYKKGYPKETKKRVLELYQDGVSSGELSGMYGMDDSTILNWVKKAEIIVYKYRNFDVIEGEEWYQFGGYDGYYEFSNLGRVKALPRKSNHYTTRILTHKYTVLGYPFVKLSKEGVDEQIFIHIIMAKLFVPNPNNLPEVNHKNLNKKDYSIGNLEWSTHGDNIRHAYENGAVNHGKMGDNANSKKIASFTEKGELVKEYSCAKEVTAIYGWHSQNLYFAVNNGTISHGFYWKYI